MKKIFSIIVAIFYLFILIPLLILLLIISWIRELVFGPKTHKGKGSYYHWVRDKNEFENAIRPMRKEDVSECVKMAMASFDGKYPEEQFNTIEEEFMAAFGNEWWGLPKYFVFEYKGQILGMGGYALSWLDWDTFEFFWLSVRKGYQGKGVGDALVKHREKEILKDSAFKKDFTIMFSCTREVINYHKKHGYKILIEKAAGKEVIMGKTFMKEKTI